jgi:RimJ/RimL family protein N-acetyltransferase
MLKGKKVVLRPLRKSDLWLYLKWFNDLEVIRNLVLYLPLTEGAEEKWIQDAMVNQRPIFVIEAILPNGRRKAIGGCGLHQIREKDRVAEFGIAIGEKKFWGNGYGTEAARLILNYGFNFLNLHKIESEAVGFNERSISMHLKVGFKKEGRRKESRHRDGKYVDSVMFGLLRSSWQKMNG